MLVHMFMISYFSLLSIGTFYFFIFPTHILFFLWQFSKSSESFQFSKSFDSFQFSKSSKPFHSFNFSIKKYFPYFRKMKKDFYCKNTHKSIFTTKAFQRPISLLFSHTTVFKNPVCAIHRFVSHLLNAVFTTPLGSCAINLITQITSPNATTESPR